MDLSKVVNYAELPGLRREADALRKDAARALDRAAEIERFIQFVESLRSPDPQRERIPGLEQEDREPLPESPTGIPAIRLVLKEHPGRTWSAREIFDIMDTRGWISPNSRNPFHGVQSGLARMFEHGEIERPGYGRYRWPGGPNANGQQPATPRTPEATDAFGESHTATERTR